MASILNKRLAALEARRPAEHKDLPTVTADTPADLASRIYREHCRAVVVTTRSPLHSEYDKETAHSVYYALLGITPPKLEEPSHQCDIEQPPEELNPHPVEELNPTTCKSLSEAGTELASNKGTESNEITPPPLVLFEPKEIDDRMWLLL